MKTKTVLTRREFLKLGSVALTGVALQLSQPVLAAYDDYDEFSAPPATLGRAITGGLAIRKSPHHKAHKIDSIAHNTVIPLSATLTGSAPWQSNALWYQTRGGFIHSGYVQPVEDHRQSDITTHVYPPGFWADVSVPLTQARWKPDSPYISRPLYYETVYRVIDAVRDNGGTWWYQLQEGTTWGSPGPYVPAEAMRRITPRDIAPIAPYQPGKVIKIDLQTQTLTCYHNDAAVFTTRVASGVWDTPTPRGEFTVLYKRHTQRMKGDDYDLAGVAFPTYFTWSGVAIHGTYWHNDYGRPHSHGCLNVPSSAARWIFRWADPTVPYYIHTRQAKANQGTKVIVV